MFATDHCTSDPKITNLCSMAYARRAGRAESPYPTGSSTPHHYSSDCSGWHSQFADDLVGTRGDDVCGRGIWRPAPFAQTGKCHRLTVLTRGGPCFNTPA